MEKTYLKEAGERLKKCRNRNFFSRRELAEIEQVPISSVIMMEQLNQKIIDAPNLYSENLQKIAHAFWSTCPKSYR